MRKRISAMERHATRLFESVERLMDRLPDFSDTCIDFVRAWDRGKRWDFLMQNTRQLVVKLQQLSESMHSTLSELEQSLNEEELSGGMSSMIEPQKRFKQEQMLLSLENMQQQSAKDFREATDLVQRLIELTEPTENPARMGTEEAAGGEAAALNVITEEEFEGMIDMSPPRVVESRSMMRQVHAEMLADTEEGGCFSRPTENIVAVAAGDAGGPEGSAQDDAGSASAAVAYLPPATSSKLPLRARMEGRAPVGLPRLSSRPSSSTSTNCSKSGAIEHGLEFLFLHLLSKIKICAPDSCAAAKHSSLVAYTPISLMEEQPGSGTAEILIFVKPAISSTFCCCDGENELGQNLTMTF